MNTQIETAFGKVVWHEHASTDAETAKSFYTDLFGWELETFKPGEADYTMIKANDQMQGGFNEPEGGAPPHWLAYVLVQSADETVEKAKSAGGSAIMDPFDVPDVGRLAILKDPQGAVFALIQPSMEGEADTPPAQGTFIWNELTTTDVGGATFFYGAVFGWTFRDEDMGGMTYTIIQRGDSELGGLMTRPEGFDVPTHWKVYIATDDADATVAKAKELGGSVIVEPTDIPDVGRFAVLQDPVGAVFGILT
jgi:predicted enzyme related to lactoylglutathione lyase